MTGLMGTDTVTSTMPTLAVLGGLKMLLNLPEPQVLTYTWCLLCGPFLILIPGFRERNE